MDEIIESHLKALRYAKVALEHSVPSECWATGPLTGNPIEDLLVCPGCKAIRLIDDALGIEEEVNYI
jgi:hypothetical protein